MGTCLVMVAASVYTVVGFVRCPFLCFSFIHSVSSCREFGKSLTSILLLVFHCWSVIVYTGV